MSRAETPILIEDRIRIGISACTMGAQVRWNNKGWDKLEPIGRERDAFVWTPVCPEVASGLGVPRPTIRLVGGNGDDFWEGNARMKNRQGKDVSDQIREGMLDSLEQLKRAQVDAFVFMEGSPSCGVYRTTLKNSRLGKPPGVFGSLLLKEQFFLIPALDLESPVKWWDWRRRLHAFAWLKNAPLPTVGEWNQIWHRYKFLCQETHRPTADELGRTIAQHSGRLTQAIYEEWKADVLALLRTPSTLKKIYGAIDKHYAHYRKQYPEGSECIAPFSRRLNKHDTADWLRAFEQDSLEHKIYFAGTPVLYRSSQR